MAPSTPSPDEPTSEEASVEETDRGVSPDAPPARPDPPIPDVIDGRYEVLRSLCKGRTGHTFEVRDRQVGGERVALRLLWAERTSLAGFRDAFFRRANLGRTVDGEHVNHVRDAGVSEDGQLYVTSDFVEGQPLSERLTHEDALRRRHALDIASQVLEALACGHEKGLVHGGVRPGNIFLRGAVPKTTENPFGVDVQLAGYGIPQLDVADSETDADAVAAAFADDLYAAPDWTDAEHADSRADLFSLGMVTCEMLLGTRAFHSGAALRIREAILGGDETRVAAQLEEVEPSVRRILLIALSRKREGRFTDAKEFRLAIESSDVYSQKARAPIALVVAALIAAGLGFFLSWRSHREVVSLREKVKEMPVAEQKDVEGTRAEMEVVAKERDAALERIKALENQLAGAAPAASSTGGAQLVAATTPVQSQDAAAWAQILAVGPEADPTRAFELAGKTGDDLDPRLLELVGKYRDGLLSRVVKQGSLGRQTLANEAALPKWTELLDKTPGAQSWPASRDVRFVGFARRFLVDGDLKPLPWEEVFEPSASATPDWRYEVYLRAEILSRHPWVVMDVDQSKVFLHKAGNEISFVHYSFRSPPTKDHGVIDSRIIDRRGDALAREQVKLTRQGTRYEWLDRRLDLVKNAATLATFEPDPAFADFSVPRQAGVREEDRKSWSQALGRADALEKLSLVFDVDGKKYWICPAFGLVRIVMGDSVQELIVSKKN